MAIEVGFSLGDELAGLSRVKRYLSAILRRLPVTLVAIMWIVFWGLVAMLDLQQGDFVSASVVGVLFVLPAVVCLAYYLRDWLPRG